MNRSSFLLPCVAFCALATGLALGLLLGTGIHEESPQAGGVLAAGGSALDAGTATADEMAAGGAASPQTHRRAAGAGNGAAPSELRTELDERVEAEVVRGTYAAGSAEIAGRVRLEDGTPLEGVLIRAEQREPRLGPEPGVGRADEPPDPEALLHRQLREAYRKYYRSRGTSREARSDAEGNFRLGGIADADYELKAYLKNHTFWTEGGYRSSRVGPGQVVRFLARKVAGVPVRVLLPGCGEPERASVNWKSLGGGARGGSGAWSPESRVMLLTPGRYEMRADVEGPTCYYTEPLKVEVAEGESSEEVTLQLREALVIEGRITLAGGEAVGERSFQVGALRFTGEVPPPFDVRVMYQGRDARVKPCSTHLEYRIEELKPGSYLLGVFSDRETFLVGERLELVDQSLKKDLVVPAVDPGDYVVVRALAPDGQPMRDFGVWGSCKREGSDDRSYFRGTKKEDGTCWIEVQSGKLDGTRVEELLIHAQSTRFGTKTLKIDPRESRLVTLRFEEASSLEVSVSGYVSTPYEDRLRVQLRSVDQGENGDRGWAYDGRMPDKEGHVVIDPVQPGTYDLVAMVDAGWWDFARAGEQRISIVPGRNAASMTLPPLYYVKVRVPESGQGVSVSLRHAEAEDENSWNAYTQTDAQGRASFGPVPAGEYSIALHEGGRRGEMRVSVPAAGEITLTPKPPRSENAYEIGIEDEKGYLAQLGLRAGDLIVGIGGIEFTDREQMEGVFKGAPYFMKGKLTLSVLRDGSRLTLEADAEALRKASELGVSLRATNR